MLSLLMAVWMAAGGPPALETARDKQHRTVLEKMAADFAAAAVKSPQDPDAQYRAALAASYAAEVALEVRDKRAAFTVAEQGVKFAEKAVSLKPGEAEYYRVLGTLCGQVVPANVLAGIGYAKRAKDAIAKAIEKDPKSSRAYMARGVGNYYLPDSFGGGPQLAVPDLRKAIELDAHNSDAYLWLGLSLRKMQKNAEARQAFQKGLELNPNRIWMKQQLEKTPSQ